MNLNVGLTRHSDVTKVFLFNNDMKMIILPIVARVLGAQSAGAVEYTDCFSAEG